MILNYIKIALRNISRHRFYAFLNIAGLATGIAVCLFILLFISDELSYDKFHEGADRIHRVWLKGKIAGQELSVAVSCPPLAQALREEVPEVESAVRLYGLDDLIIKKGDALFTEQKAAYADSSFFSVFTFELEGDPATALKEPQTLVLTDAYAKKYFGNQNPINQTLTIGSRKTEYKVTGVIRNKPSNTHLPFEMLLSMEGFDYAKSPQWLSNSFYTYFKLKENTSVESVKAKMDEMVLNYAGPELEKFTGMSFKEMGENGGIYNYNTEPLTEIYLHSDVNEQIGPVSDIRYIYILSAIALFITLIACVNFMNLATARSSGRAKEVGIRKVMGALKGKLIRQFLAESIVFSMLSTLVALALLFLLLTPFNNLAGKSLEFSSLFTADILLMLLGLTLLVGLAAGSYPAFYLTSFQPVNVLKGKLQKGMKSVALRNALVVFQFGISIALIICTGIVFQQLEFMQSKNLGFEKDNVLVVSNARRLDSNQRAFIDMLKQESVLSAASVSSSVPPGVNNTTIFRVAEQEEDHILAQYGADWDHQETMQMEMAEGRWFSRDFPSDTLALVINEAAVKELNLEEPVGADIIYFNGNDNANNYKVVGVVKDFNFESLKTEIRPMAITMTTAANKIALRLQPGSSIDAVARIEAKWKEMAPGEPFEFSFVDQEFNELFKSEQQMGQIITVFTVLAIFIACLGLFGLAAFIAEQRIKEIGIRKVLGASVSGLVLLLSKDFTVLVLISFLPAAVLSYWLMSNWLEEFAYHIEIEASVFLASIAVALAVAWLTVSYQSVKAALSNPVKSLKSE